MELASSQLTPETGYGRLEAGSTSYRAPSAQALGDSNKVQNHSCRNFRVFKVTRYRSGFTPPLTIRPLDIDRVGVDFDGQAIGQSLDRPGDLAEIGQDQARDRDRAVADDDGQDVVPGAGHLVQFCREIAREEQALRTAFALTPDAVAGEDVNIGPAQRRYIQAAANGDRFHPAHSHAVEPNQFLKRTLGDGPAGGHTT